MTAPIDVVRERLTARGLEVKGGWSEFSAKCPAHTPSPRSKNLSLSVKENSDGRVLLYCHWDPPCTLDAIVAALDLTMGDLFPEAGYRPHPQQVAAPRRQVATYSYHDEQGTLLYQSVRYEPKGFSQRRPDGNGGWILSTKDVRRVPYRLPHLREAVTAGRRVFIVEGERDADRLAELGLIATTNVGGAGKWLSDYTPYLAGAHVTVIGDNDDAGRRHVAQVAQALEPVAASLQVLELPGLPAAGDVSDWLDARHGRGDLEALVNATGPADVQALTAPKWDPPQPIPKTPTTPLPTLSGDIGDVIDAVAVAYQVPRDLPFLVLLGILGIATRGRRRVRVAPDWTEVLAVYAAALLPSAERKSPVVGSLSRPLRDVERELIDKARPTFRLRRDLYDVHTKAVDKLKRKGDTSPDAMNELREARETLDCIEVPTLPRLVVDDVTPEAMAKIMAEQDGRIGVLSTEAGLFATLAGRYSNGTPNLDLVLKAWSGDPCQVDRIGREPDILDEPVLSMALAFQPDVLAGFADTRQFRGAGLLARWLYALPETKLGARELRPQQVSETTYATYSSKLRQLVETMHASDTVDMKLTEEAVDVFDGFRARLEPRLHPDVGDLHDIADWAGKLPGQLVTPLTEIPRCCSPKFPSEPRGGAGGSVTECS